MIDGIFCDGLEKTRYAAQLFRPVSSQAALSRVRGKVWRLSCLLSVFWAAAFFIFGSTSLRADPASPNGWSYRFTSYSWLTSINGSQTVKGRTTDIDASFIDLAEHAKIPKDLFALGGYFEARKGPVSLFTDIFYSKVAIGASSLRSRGVDSLGASVGASLGLKFEMVTAQLAAAYEIAKWGGADTASYTALDIYGGARIWWQQLDASLSLSGTVNIGDLTVVGGRAIARSGDVSWVDPLIGLRLRHQIAPGKEFVFTADVGGFNAGSKISWQASGTYNWDFLVTKDAVWSGVVGYKALYVDYTQGTGISRYEFDILQYGPVLGVTAKF